MDDVPGLYDYYTICDDKIALNKTAIFHQCSVFAIRCSQIWEVEWSIYFIEYLLTILGIINGPLHQHQ